MWTAAGDECWVLIHVEVQTAGEAGFAQRMYVYNYRVFNRYNKPVASLAVLADDDPNWRPQGFRSELFGCEVALRFPTAKLLDFADHEAVLEASANPFASVVMAHLKALQTRANPADRHAWKLRLVRGLYERGFSVEDVRKLFRLIDWMMQLPPALAKAFSDELDRLQEKPMPYITSYERELQRRALRLGIQTALEIRFGVDGLKLMPLVEVIYEEEKLEAVLQGLKSAATLEDARRLCSPDNP